MDIYYTIYKITNNANGKTYIGAHKTSNIDDGYMGSGKYLKHAYQKYGMDNFTKTIIAVYDNSCDMYENEKLLVNEAFVARKDTYNIKVGGHGGFDHIDNSGENNPMRKYPELAKKIGIKVGIASKKRHDNQAYRDRNVEILKKARKLQDKMYPEGTFKGKLHKESTKQIMSKKASARVGDKNSSYGSCWIHNNKNNKKIKKTELEEYLTLGWIKGRKMKF